MLLPQYPRKDNFKADKTKLSYVSDTKSQQVIVAPGSLRELIFSFPDDIEPVLGPTKLRSTVAANVDTMFWNILFCTKKSKSIKMCVEHFFDNEPSKNLHTAL